eukprot:gene21031-27900_t
MRPGQTWRLLSYCRSLIGMGPFQGSSARGLYESSPVISSPGANFVAASTVPRVSGWNFTWAASCGFAWSAMSTVALCEEDTEVVKDEPLGRYFFLSKETRQRIFFMYEKRIRDLSALEKVFDYFSSQVRRSLAEMISHCPGDSTEMVINNPTEITKRDVEIIFSVIDKDGDGSVTVDEFRELLDMLNASGDNSLQKAMLSARLQDIEADNIETGLFHTFFGKDLNGRLKLRKFSTFLNDLHEELVHLEFCHYLPPEVDKLGDKLGEMKINFHEFRSVHFEMQIKLADLAVALTMLNQVGGCIEVDEFNRLIKKIVGIQLTDQVIEVIDLMFGEESGVIDVTTFLECLQRRETLPGRFKDSLTTIED